MIVPPPPVPVDVIEAQAKAHHLQGVGLLEFAKRQTAKERAHTHARAYAREESLRLNGVYRDLQEQSSQWWANLCANDESTVCEAINAAFSDNPSAGCAVGVSESTLSVVMRQQDIDSLPDQTPGMTAAGRPRLKALTKKDRMAWWLAIMTSSLAATAKEAFAVAPGITDVSIAVLSRVPGSMQLGVVAFGTWSRAVIDGTPWCTPEDAYRILDVGRDVACSVRSTSPGALSATLKPLDLIGLVELRTLLDAAEDDGMETLGHLDSAMTANRPPTQPHRNPHPYALTSFSTWVSAHDHRFRAAPQVPNQPPPTTALQLAAGQTVILPEHATFIAHVDIECTAPIQEVAADLSVLLLESNRKVGSNDDFVFYNHPHAANQSVRLAPQATSSAIVRERAEVHLALLPRRVTRILVALSMDIDSDQSFEAVDLVSIAVTSANESWTFRARPDPAIKAMVGIEFYRHTAADGREVWKLRAVGEGWAGGLAEMARLHGVDID